MQPGPEQSRDLFAALTRVAMPTGLGDGADETRFSPHAAQLRKGFRWLRFEPELERQVLAFYQQRYLIRTRIALVAGAILFGLFSLRDLRTLPDEVWPWTVGLRLLLIVPMILLVVGASYVRVLRPQLEWLTAFGVTAAMGGLAAAILVSARMGAPLPYEGLMLVMVFAIFLSGLRFYKATASTFLSAASYIAARVALDLPDAETMQEAYYMYGITLIGLLGGYSLELSQRTNFLNEHIALFRAARDPLTHLYNRRAALDHLQRTWRLAFRDRTSVAVALLDVDHFKRFNDRYGHLQGDRCLTDVAVALRDRVRRPLDIVARYGGEEFLIVLYDVTEATLRVICEDVRRAVCALGIAHGDNHDAGVVTVSLGAAWVLPSAGEDTVETALERADQALYRAKDAGRNRCEIQTPRFATVRTKVLG